LRQSPAEHRPKRRELFHAARQDAGGMRGWQRDRWGRSQGKRI
jgi:hypothetical protein